MTSISFSTSAKCRPVVGSSSRYSVLGGSQSHLQQIWQYINGNWWLYIDSHPIGYYPGSLYGNGPLASGAATVVDFGGEDTGAPSALEMGSGQVASAGGTYVAYQATIDYYNSAVGKDGALSKREKALIALAVSHVKKCPYCIDAYTQDGLAKGCDSEQLTEVAHVAAAIRGGAALIHGVQMKNVIEKLGM